VIHHMHVPNTKDSVRQQGHHPQAGQPEDDASSSLVSKLNRSFKLTYMNSKSYGGFKDSQWGIGDNR
jgi:hypothetical protein